MVLAEMGVKSSLKISECEGGVKGNSGRKGRKGGRLESGGEVGVGLLVKEGESMEIERGEGR